ncbi:MAG: ABC transporter substrate-binding protein [Actinomycetota bacterium]
MRTPSRWLISLLVVLALGASACGGGDDDAGSASSSDTATESASSSSSASTAATEAEDEPADDEPADGSAEDDDPDVVEDDPEPAEPEDEAEPADDGRMIVTLDETAAFALLSLGIEPDMVLTTLTSEPFAAINAELGVPTTDFVIAEPSFEILAGLAPDLIVGIGSPFVTQSVAEYEQIAPTFVIPVDLGWQDQLRALAEEMDTVDRAEAVIAAVDGLQTDVAAQIAAAGADGTTVSLLTVRVGNVLAADSAGSTGSILAAVGLDRPETQQAAGPDGVPFIFLSDEQVPLQDADLLLLGEAEIFDLTPLLESPVYDQLSAVQNDSVHRVVGDPWMLGGTGLATYWVLNDLLGLLVTGEPVATLDSATEVWAGFLELVG